MLSRNGILALVLLGALAGLYGLHRGIVASEVREAKQTVTTTLNKEYQERLDAARKASQKTEDELRLNAFNKEKDKNAEIANVSSELKLALERLRNRPERPAPNTSGEVATSTSSCTAVSLYRPDAEFLTREASRAQSVLIERDYYYSLYEETRIKLDGQK